MNKKTDCNIIRDLLPSYADGLTSESTNKTVEEHLSECEECLGVYKRMKDEPESEKPADKEIDYMKKVRRGTTKKSWGIGILLAVIGIALLCFRFFYIGSEADPDDINFDVSVSDGTVYISGDAISNTQAITRVVLTQSANIVDVKVYTAPKAFFNRSYFTEVYNAEGEVGSVRSGELFLWWKGTQISPTAAKLYAAINPFVGDMPSNEEVANIIGIRDQFGAYTNELQTANEPYGWIVILEEPISTDEENTAKDIMAADSYVMLATVENLGSVSWKYETAEGVHEYTVTEEDASIYEGRFIKSFAESPAMMQTLLESLSIKWSGVREVLQENGYFRLVFTNRSDDEIYALSVNYYLNGKQVGSSTGINADNTSIKKGDNFYFEFTPKDFPAGTSAVNLEDFTFDFSVTDENGNEAVVSESMSLFAKYAWTYYFTFEGDFENGFVLHKG